MKKKTEGLV